MNRKGMSQTLALIVAASVLMMTALSLIFLTQGSLQRMFGKSGQTSESTCTQSLNFRLGNTEAQGTFTIPSSCTADMVKSECGPGDIAKKTSAGGYTCSY